MDISAVDHGFGCDCFDLPTMKRYLSTSVYNNFRDTITRKTPLTPATAEEIANAMRTWAMEKGATHFTHWFQPLNGLTAEKHDSFLVSDSQAGVIAHFSGKDLLQGEPDASSFPSGGLRATFEARGYTGWDPTSYAFVVNANTPQAVLCIPCVFCSYNGEPLDAKTPMLRSQEALIVQLNRVADLFEVPDKKRPYVTLGAEQEYFLIDRKYFQKRPDLIMCGRSLFGRCPARHQQLEDHYFGRIPQRVLAFMAEVDKRLRRLGVPVKTRHNETSPAQYELAPIFEEQNLATDHNFLIMQTLQETAESYGLACLLHEKPFAGVNGSGKHNNWSLVGRDGKNWFSPGDTPHDNAKFLFIITAVIKAIDTYQDLLRASVASAGNDYRLGASEAPPAIISVFLGEQLSDIVDQIEAGGATKSKSGGLIEIGVSALPQLPRDVTDRNRTSPFAFTGNKFEFRAVGSSQSCALPNTILNMAMTAALDDMCTELEKIIPKDRVRDEHGHSTEFHQGLQQVLQAEISKHKRIIFGGDGYSQSWEEEAKRRGLSNYRTTPEALVAFTTTKAKDLFEKYHVLTGRELISRYEIYMQAWEQTIILEGACAADLARTFILPAGLELERILGESAERAARFCREDRINVDAYMQVADLIQELHINTQTLENALTGGAQEVISALANLRSTVDQLETLAPDATWPFPSYGDMFFNN